MNFTELGFSLVRSRVLFSVVRRKFAPVYLKVCTEPFPGLFSLSSVVLASFLVAAGHTRRARREGFATPPVAVPPPLCAGLRPLRLQHLPCQVDDLHLFPFRGATPGEPLTNP